SGFLSRPSGGAVQVAQLLHLGLAAPDYDSLSEHDLPNLPTVHFCLLMSGYPRFRRLSVAGDPTNTISVRLKDPPRCVGAHLTPMHK
ncbi:hypothetical protein FCULG_00000712, partial [Fusarium culmorum]